MKKKWIIICCILITAASGVYALLGKPHEFSSDECSLCHFDEKNDLMNIKPRITYACETCHANLKQTQSHPTDIYPMLSIPKDMPLTQGKLTCITCHYVHPKKKKLFVRKPYFLRRLVRGPLFCNVCHEFDKKGHIALEEVHPGSYKQTDRKTRIDRMSLGCIECHDTYLTEPVKSLGAGTWNHYSKLNHPIGISYKRISSKKMRGFRPAGMLGKEIRLYDGKIGCGTCHNIYSKRKFMLPMDNMYSKLCLECHIK